MKKAIPALALSLMLSLPAAAKLPFGLDWSRYGPFKGVVKLDSPDDFYHDIQLKYKQGELADISMEIPKYARGSLKKTIKELGYRLNSLGFKKTGFSDGVWQGRDESGNIAMAIVAKKSIVLLIAKPK